MKRFKAIRNAAFMIIALCACGCASSYQDRIDALAPGESPPPVDDGTLVADSVTSRDELMLSGACIVSADCRSTEHCELGRCIAECSPNLPCAEGLFCSARGRCVSSKDYIDADLPIKAAPPVSWSLDKRVVQLAPDQANASLKVQVAGGGALQYRVQVEPEAYRSAVSVSEPAGVIASYGEKTISVTIDRSALGAGDHQIAIGVVTDGGQQNVILEVSNDIGGRYAGFVQYTQPAIGQVPLVVDIKAQDGGAVSGRILSEGSLLFPEARGLQGSYDAGQRKILLSSADVIAEGSDYDPFGRSVGREISFSGDVAEAGVIKGEVEEIVSGLMPQSQTIEGVFYLTRISESTSSETAGIPQQMPGFTAPSNVFGACAGFSDSCNTEAKFRSNMAGCTQELSGQAYKLGDAFSGIDQQGKAFVDFGLVEECKKDAAGTGAKACVDLNALLCLQTDGQAYLLSSLAQPSEFDAYLDGVIDLQRLYAFMGNDMLVDAYRSSVESASNPLSLELSRLNESLGSYVKAERAFFDAGNISAMDRAPVASLARNDFELFRVPLRYIRSSQSALQRVVSLELRKNLGQADQRAALRERVQDSARAIFLQSVALSRLVAKGGGSFKYELAQMADELRAVSAVETQLEAGLNPLGFDKDDVAFIFDSNDSLRPTNFSQLHKKAAETVDAALDKAQLAQNTVEQMQVRTDDISQRVTEINQTFDSEIQRICGVNSVQLIDQCGQSGGDLAVAANDLDQQYTEIEKIHQQILDLNEMVKIKNDVALQIAGIKGKTLAFVQASGAQMGALDMASAEVRAAMLRRSSFWGALGSIITGGISSIVDGALTGGLAGGLSGGANFLGNGISAGIGAINGARSADESIMQGQITSQKTGLQQMQQMRFQEEGMEIAAIQAAEEVKLLLLQMAQLNIDLTLAEARLEQRMIRIADLLQRVDLLLNQREVLLDQALESVQNPLTNLAFRIQRDHSVLMAANDFDKALSDVYLAARGLEHELNVDLPQIESQLFQADSASQLKDFLTCLDGWYDDYAIAFGSPHEQVTQISLREDILGFTRPVTDEVTKEVIGPEEIFRRVLLDPKHITASGSVEFPFITSISGSDKQFSSLVCNDRIKSIRVMLVGDYLGDNEATVMLRQEGDSALRDCASNPDNGQDLINIYRLDSRTAHIQAGINSFGIATPDYELAGRSVASERWVLVIPTGKQAPNNTDMDLTSIDDVIIEITHTARTLSSDMPTNVFGQCNL